MSVVGLVTALRAEAGCIVSAHIPFNEKVSIDDQTLLWLSGMGGAAARAAAEGLCRQGVTALVSFGVAGALDDRLKPGDLVLPDAIHCGTALTVNLAWRDRLQQRLPSRLTVVNGMIANSEIAVTNEAAKRDLAQTTGACAVDMESAAIAQVAAQAGIPFIVVRTIVDPIQFSPPEALLSAIHPDGSVKPIHLTALLLKRSVRISTLLQMGAAMRAARKTLSQVIESAGARLARHTAA